MYSLQAYYFTKMLIEIPILLLQPLLMQIIVFWAIGYRSTEDSFWMQYVALALLVQCGASIGFTISSIAENIVVAQSIAPAFVMPL